MQTQNHTAETYNANGTQPDTLKADTLAALRRFARQRPGLDYANYGDPVAYRAEMRGITNDLKEAQILLRQIELFPSITGRDLMDIARHSAGRLKIETVRRWECACGHKYAAPVKYSANTPNLSGEVTAWCPECGARPLQGSAHEVKVDYCTGQYFPTEYRAAVARFCASVLWDFVREHAMPTPVYRVEWKNERGEWVEATKTYDNSIMAEMAAKVTREQLQREALTAFDTPPPRYGETMIVERYRFAGLPHAISAGDWLRRYFRREFGRGIASRFFN
jgi:hypothetical protein